MAQITRQQQLRRPGSECPDIRLKGRCHHKYRMNTVKKAIVDPKPLNFNVRAHGYMLHI